MIKYCTASTERIENAGNLSSRLRQTTHHATTPPQPEPIPNPTPVSRKDLVAAQRKAERLSREARLFGPVAGVVPSPSPLPRTPRDDLGIAQRRAVREARKTSGSVAEVTIAPPASPPPRTPRSDAAIAQRRAEREARKLSEPVVEVAVVPPASPHPRTPRSDAAVAQRRAEREARKLSKPAAEVATVPSPSPLSRTPRNDSAIAQRRAARETPMLFESAAEAAEVVPLTSRLPRASRNNAALAQRTAERETREVTKKSNAASSGRSTGDAKQRLFPAATNTLTMDHGQAKNDLSPLEAEDTTNLDSFGIEMPQFRGAEEVSADLTDIFGDIPTSPSTGLTASAPKVQPTKYNKAYLLRRFAGDYTHYISGPSKVYTTTPDKLGAINHAAHILSRRQDVPTHLRQDALKIIQHATR